MNKMKNTIQSIKEQVEAGVNFVVSAESGLGKLDLTKQALNELNKRFELLNGSQCEELFVEFVAILSIKKPEVIIVDEADRIEKAREYNNMLTFAKEANIQVISLVGEKEHSQEPALYQMNEAIWYYINAQHLPIVSIDKEEAQQKAAETFPWLKDVLNHPQK
jgi:Holliday junction resolvasome RuvABC ATP-dependent DNA helicase subunit